LAPPGHATARPVPAVLGRECGRASSLYARLPPRALTCRWDTCSPKWPPSIRSATSLKPMQPGSMVAQVCRIGNGAEALADRALASPPTPHPLTDARRYCRHLLLDTAGIFCSILPASSAPVGRIAAVPQLPFPAAFPVIDLGLACGELLLLPSNNRENRAVCRNYIRRALWIAIKARLAKWARALLRVCSPSLDIFLVLRASLCHDRDG